MEIYEDVIPDVERHHGDAAFAGALKQKGIEIEPVDTQQFLAQQMEVLEARREDGREAKERGSMFSGGAAGAAGAGGEEGRGGGGGQHGRSGSKNLHDGGGVRDHVGPVQFNVGGIQMDADDMVKGIKVSKPSIHLFPTSRYAKALTLIHIKI